MKILHLSVNATQPLDHRLSEEARAMDEVLRKSAVGRNFQVESHGAVRVSDIQELLLRHSPQIVHFSGQGAGEDGLVFQDEFGNAKLVPPRALANLFSFFKDKVRCVVLNACFSVEQAKGIAEHIDYVIGMNAEIQNKASISFAAAFYQALGYEQSMERAFALGRSRLELEGLADAEYPELFTKSESHNRLDRSPGPVKIEWPYGTMRPTSPFYIAREADHICQQTCGVDSPFTLFIQAPRQVGKSSLMQRVCHTVRQSDEAKVIYINFESFEQAQLDNLSAMLIQICLIIGNALNVEPKIDRFFGGPGSKLMICSNYLSTYLMPTVEGSVILAMDEVDRVLGKPFQNDFFGMLRSWHNDRAIDPQFARVSLFLSSSTEPKLFIDNPYQSPFNVAQRVTLSDFTRSEVEELNQRHGSPLSSSQINELMKLLAGHPFLTRLSLYLIAMNQISFERLCAQALAQDGPFGDHLQHFWKILQEEPVLRATIKTILKNQTHTIDRNVEKLKGAGLVKQEHTAVVMRNELYARYFKERLNG